MTIVCIEEMEQRLDACCAQSLNTTTTSDENSKRITILEMPVEENKRREAYRECIWQEP